VVPHAATPVAKSANARIFEGLRIFDMDGTPKLRE